jgi:hypothetical protein
MANEELDLKRNPSLVDVYEELDRYVGIIVVSPYLNLIIVHDYIMLLMIF